MSSFIVKRLFSALAVAIGVLTFIPYIRDVNRGLLKPHVFSWFIWGLATVIVFFAQLAAGGGVGAWSVGVSGLLTLVVTYLAYRRRADTHITTGDWIFLAASLSALPLWFFTSDPLWAVVILTAVDLIAYGPTVRRAYNKPHEESVLMFASFGVRNTLVVLALEHYSLATLLFPVAVGIACVMVAVMLVIRRRVVNFSLSP